MSTCDPIERLRKIMRDGLNMGMDAWIAEEVGEVVLQLERERDAQGTHLADAMKTLQEARAEIDSFTGMSEEEDKR